MINNIKYTNIREILDNCMQHELLQDLTLEQVVGYVIRFNGIFNIPQLFIDKEAHIVIKEYRGALPCDLFSVVQVKDTYTNAAIPEISGTFFNPNSLEKGFKTQGQVIFTTFKEGEIDLAYKAIPVDSEGYPLIMDNERYKNALELYIKKIKFTGYFDLGKIAQNVLQNTEQQYAWAAGQLEEELKMPSYSEWENISNAHSHLLPKTMEFTKGFETLGIIENYKRH